MIESISVKNNRVREKTNCNQQPAANLDEQTNKQKFIYFGTNAFRWLLGHLIVRYTLYTYISETICRLNIGPIP